MRPDPLSLKLFVAVLEAGSIAAAVERGHIAPAAVSKRMSELEAVLRTRLLTRTNKGVQATPAGLALANLARRLLADLDDIAIQMRDWSGGTRGQVRIVANISAITQFLPKEIGAFLARYPQVDVHLQERISTAVMKAVQENEADVGICVPGMPADRLDENMRIHMQEVGTRDGLQVEGAFVPTEDKIALVDALSQAGMAKIEVTAFVSPQAIPALRDAEIVLREIERRPGVVYSALVPNVRGAERAIEARADELNLVMSASETHNLAKLRMTRDQSFAALSQVAALARNAGVPVNISLSCSFGCPMEGDVPEATVLDWARRFVEEIGARGVTLCDTTGMAYPGPVAALTRNFRECWPGSELTLHFHNTRGMGLANVLAAIDAGADRFDASLGGLGGCPYAPGATGNVCSEEIVHALELMGYDTGVDLPRLIDAARRLPALIGHDIPSQIVKAGRRLDLHRVPAGFDTIRERALARSI